MAPLALVLLAGGVAAAVATGAVRLDATARAATADPSAGARPAETGVAALSPPSPSRSLSVTPSAASSVAGRANRDGVNLALRKRAVASSVESSSWPAAAAVDGKLASRWSSGFADPQWIRVDLGERWVISDISLAWEHAYPVKYRVDVSVDGKHWTTVYRTTTGTDGVRDIGLKPMPARFVRVYTTKRSGPYGVSLQELEVR